jgi:hypothetical protein
VAKSVKNLAQFEGREQKSHRFSPDNIHFQHPKINFLSMKKKSMVIDVAPNQFSYTCNKVKFKYKKKSYQKPQAFLKNVGTFKTKRLDVFKKDRRLF